MVFSLNMLRHTHTRTPTDCVMNILSSVLKHLTGMADEISPSATTLGWAMALLGTCIQVCVHKMYVSVRRVCCALLQAELHSPNPRANKHRMPLFERAFNRKNFPTVNFIFITFVLLVSVHCQNRKRKETKYNSLECTNDSCPRLFCRKAFLKYKKSHKKYTLSTHSLTRIQPKHFRIWTLEFVPTNKCCFYVWSTMAHKWLCYSLFAILIYICLD